MNILMLGWELPPHNSGGLGVACYHMAKALSLRGVNIDFVVPYSAHHPGIDFMNIHSASKLAPSQKFGLGAYDSRNVIQGSLEKADMSDLTDMRGVQKRYGVYVEQLLEEIETPDVIHAHDWLTIEAGIRAKQITNSPLVVHVHATEFDRSASNSGNPLVHEIEYQGLMMADRIIAVSSMTKDIIVKKYQIPEDKIEVVHNAIDVNDFDPYYEYDMSTYKYLESMKSEGYLIVSTLTRLTVQKGLPYFLQAAARALSKYDKMIFLISGDGEQRDELIKLSADLGISDKVLITGFVRGKQWRDTYSVSDVFVMSSVSEPFGLTALEAAHHDNALIITKQSGVSEVLRSIFKYDFWDIDRLADQLVGIATSRALESTLKANAKSEYSRFSWNDVAAKCVKIYSHQAQKEEVLV